MSSTALEDRPDVAADLVPLEPVMNVVVWFGEHRLADWTGPQSEAAAISTAWGVRFGTRIEVRRVPDVELAAKAGVEWT